MGRSSSKLLETANGPLQELQLQEKKRERQRRKWEKEQKQIAKLQKKHAKKHKKRQKQSLQEVQAECRSSQGTRSSDGQHMGSSLNFHSMRYEFNREDINQQIESKTQNLLDSDLSIFTMNQISLSLQFFGNYESEITAISDELLAQENQFNQNLTEHSILLTNPLDVAVAKWMRYKPNHGPDKQRSQLLQPPALYVVFENIDVGRPNDANYDSISPICKVNMETNFYKTTPCKESYIQLLQNTKWKGFVRLKLRENPKMPRNASSTGAEIYTDGSSGYSTTSGYSIKILSSTGSSNNNSEDLYDYAFIAHLNSHHPLSELKMRSQREKEQMDAKVLPESCVCSLGNIMKPWHEDTDDETDNESTGNEDEDEEGGYSSDDEAAKDSRRDYETLQALKLYKIEQERRKLLMGQRYLNSREFMRYFVELLRQELAPKLYIPQKDIELGSYRGATIYTSQFEIIPAIHVAQNAQSWPECAFQFRIRDRPITTSPLTGQQFQWPTRSMIKRIETFGFHIIPMGYAPKRLRNPYRELEWRIVFPKAERYLERHLTSAQVKVFMMTKALVKTFVEPREESKSLMFAMDHLRTHLFWECERNFTAWPEEFLGEVLVRFISSFMQCLREKCLSDFFIQERNLFESIPEYSLVTLYSILADIIANPLMHLMVAFRNLHFTQNLFPKLNFKKLFDNFYETDVMKLKLLAKNARVSMDNETADNETTLMTDDGARGLVGMKQHREKTNGRLRRKTQLMRHHIEMKKKQDLELRRMSVESIDVEFFFNKNLQNTPTRNINQGIENLRRTNILEMVIDHLLPVAEKALDMQNVQLAKLCLSQARRLCKFYHNYGCDLGAKEYLASIHQLDEDIEVAQRNESTNFSPPALPTRASVEPVRPSQIKNFNDQHCSKSNAFAEETYHSFTRRTATVDFVIENPENQLSTTKLNECDLITLDNNSVTTTNVTKLLQSQTCDNNKTKPHCYSPISIPRFLNEVSEKDNGEISMEDTAEIVATAESVACSQEMNHLPTTSVELPSDKIPAEATFKSKFGPAASILKNTPMGSLKIMTTLTASTEKLISNLTADEKRLQLRELLKRKTVQLKGVLNQSSES